MAQVPPAHSDTDPRPPEPLQKPANPSVNLLGCFPARRGAHTSSTELFWEAGRLWGRSQQCKELQSCLLQGEHTAWPEVLPGIFPAFDSSEF